MFAERHRETQATRRGGSPSDELFYVMRYFIQQREHLRVYFHLDGGRGLRGSNLTKNKSEQQFATAADLLIPTFVHRNPASKSSVFRVEGAPALLRPLPPSSPPDEHDQRHDNARRRGVHSEEAIPSRRSGAAVDTFPNLDAQAVRIEISGSE